MGVNEAITSFSGNVETAHKCGWATTASMGTCSTAGVFSPTTGTVPQFTSSYTASRRSGTVQMILRVAGYTGTVQGVSTTALTALANAIIAAGTNRGITITKQCSV